MKLGLGNSLVLPRGGGGPGGVPIPSDHAKLLLHFDSDFSDSSIHNRTPDLVGGTPPTIDAVNLVMGEGSLKTTSTSGQIGRLQYPSSVDWAIADGTPWQASFRAYKTVSGGDRLFLSRTSVEWGVGWQLGPFNGDTTLGLASNAAVRASWPYSFPVSTWTAHRINYDGSGNYRWYVNGTLLGVRTASGIVEETTAPFIVGGRAMGQHHQGNIDEFLWEKHAGLEITTSPTYEVETEPFVIV